MENSLNCKCNLTWDSSKRASRNKHSRVPYSPCWYIAYHVALSKLITEFKFAVARNKTYNAGESPMFSVSSLSRLKGLRNVVLNYNFPALQCFAKAGKMEPNQLFNGFGPLQPAVAVHWSLRLTSEVGPDRDNSGSRRQMGTRVLPIRRWWWWLVSADLSPGL